MTEQDRGAYTPQTDEALAFDARRQSEHRPIPMTLVGSAIVLVLLIVAVAVVYRGGVRGADEAPRPIGQPVVSVKTPPPIAVATANSVGAADVGDGKTTVAAIQPALPLAKATPPSPYTSATKVRPVAVAAPKAANPVFAPAPEEPAPRPEPAAKTLALLDQPGQTASTARIRGASPASRPIRTVGGLDASEVAAAGMTGTRQASPPSTAAASTFKVATSTPPPGRAKATGVPGPVLSDSLPAGSPAAAGGPVVQIGAFSSAALSEQGYADVKKIMAGQMAGKAKHVMTVDHAGATLFRTWVSGFASRAQADAFCAALKASNKPCFVKG
jgi:hypothetical protein